MKNENNIPTQPLSQLDSIVPDLTDMNEVRKAVIAGEILNRKY
jgi:hypothetical protein